MHTELLSIPAVFHREQRISAIILSYWIDLPASLIFYSCALYKRVDLKQLCDVYMVSPYQLQSNHGWFLTYTGLFKTLKAIGLSTLIRIIKDSSWVQKLEF